MNETRAGLPIDKGQNANAADLDPAFMRALHQMLANDEVMAHADRVMGEEGLREICFIQ